MLEILKLGKLNLGILTQELIEEAQIFDKSKNPSIDKLEISYRNWVPLEIEDVK